MKKLTAFLSVLALCLVFVLSVSAVDNIIWDFSKEEDVAQWKPTKTTNVQVTENGAIISGTGDDINLTFTPAAGQVINLDDYSVLAIKYQDNTGNGNMQFYHWTDANTGNPYFTVNASKQPKLQRFNTKDTSANPTSKWTGKVKSLRFDPCRSSEERTMTVLYIGLFVDGNALNAYDLGGDMTAKELQPGDPVLVLNLGVQNPLFGMNATDCTFEYTDDYVIMTSTNGPDEDPDNVGDPHVSVATSFDGDAYPWMKIRLRNLSDSTEFEMHFAAKGAGVAAASCTHFPISSKDEDFKEYIINIKDANLASQAVNDVHLTESAWGGEVTELRFDALWYAEPSGQVPTGSQMYIDYAAFFASEQEAMDYVLDPATGVEQAKYNTGRENPTWIFDNEEMVNTAFSAGGLAATYEGGMLRVTPTSGDPTMTFYIDDAFAAEEFPYFAMRHRMNSTVKVTGIFFTTSNLTSLSDASWSPMYITANGSWENTIVKLDDLAKYPKGNWNGNVGMFRLDPINGTDLNAEIYIDRLGFFRTQAEALAFLNAGRTALDYSKDPVTVYADKQTAVIPAGVVTEGYDKTQYTMANPVPAQGVTNPVVVRTNADGTQDVVALSYYSASGYTNFVAAKPGKYELASNHKDYTDIAGHWGADYITFVSDRTLFGGTSPTEFSPDMPMTRGMFITVLGRMHGLDTSAYDGNTGYGDVPATEYYAPYIQWAKQMNLMAGLSDATFGAEDPITRDTMAVVIANYLKAYNYDITGYSDPIEFTDLGDCDAATVEAIKMAQKADILNGKGDGLFDPKGLSTRAEVAAVMERVIKGVLKVNMASTPYDADYFQRKRIRIGAWGFMDKFANERGMTLLRDLGVDLIISGSATTSAHQSEVLNYADKYGIELFINDGYCASDAVTSNHDYVSTTLKYSEHPSFSGTYFTDEPGTDAMGWIGDAMDLYMKQLPGKIPFVNLLPMYANAAQLKYGASAAAIEYYDADPDLFRNYCETWFDETNVDYICTDIYPLNGRSGVDRRDTWATYKDYCESINQIATVAREHDAEFWCCIQTWGWTSGKRSPTEGEYRWQSYTMLSYGCTGILLWSLNTSDPDFPSVFNGYTDDVTRPLYDDCAAVMWELRKLSDTYIQYKNLGAFTMNCTSATPYLKMSGEYKDFNILSETVSSEPLLIGCFQKAEGTGYAFTVVNMTDLKDNKPATFKFKLAQPMTVTLYNRAEPTVLTAGADGYYTINLESTDGYFVTLG